MRHRGSVSARSSTGPRGEHHEQRASSRIHRPPRPSRPRPARTSACGGMPRARSLTRPRPARPRPSPLSGTIPTEHHDHAPRTPSSTPHGHTIELPCVRLHASTPVAVARFYGKRRKVRTIESRRHDRPRVAASNPTTTWSDATIPTEHRRPLHFPRTGLHGRNSGKPDAGGCHDTLPAQHRANALAPAATPVLEGRKPATSKQT